LLDLIQSLYSAHKDNQIFLHSRFGLGGDVLKPYKRIIDRWLWPDVLRNQDTSVFQAKRAISDYKKVVGDPEGVAELMVFYCEQAAGFCDDICSDDEGYFDALVRMFEQALKFANALSPDRRDDQVSRSGVNQFNGSTQFNYAAKHNPQVFFSDSTGGDDRTPADPRSQQYAPVQQLLIDLANNTVADYNGQPR
jgi:hypothetical protein